MVVVQLVPDVMVEVALHSFLKTNPKHNLFVNVSDLEVCAPTASPRNITCSTDKTQKKTTHKPTREQLDGSTTHTETCPWTGILKAWQLGTGLPLRRSSHIGVRCDFHGA